MALSPRMAQSKRLSLIEAITNTVVGYILAVATQLAVFPAFGLRLGVVETGESHLSFDSCAELDS